MSRKRRPVHTGPLNDAMTPPDALKRLWGAVLLQAARDLVTSSQRPSDQLEAWRVRGWIDTADFGEVCRRAELDEDATRRWMRDAASDPAGARRMLRAIEQKVMGGAGGG